MYPHGALGYKRSPGNPVAKQVGGQGTRHSTISLIFLGSSMLFPGALSFGEVLTPNYDGTVEKALIFAVARIIVARQPSSKMLLPGRGGTMWLIGKRSWTIPGRVWPLFIHCWGQSMSGPAKSWQHGN